MNMLIDALETLNSISLSAGVSLNLISNAIPDRSNCYPSLSQPWRWSKDNFDLFLTIVSLVSNLEFVAIMIRLCHPTIRGTSQWSSLDYTECSCKRNMLGFINVVQQTTTCAAYHPTELLITMSIQQQTRFTHDLEAQRNIIWYRTTTSVYIKIPVYVFHGRIDKSLS